MPDPTRDPLSLLPHREPFRFLTSLLSLRPGQDGVAAWEISGDEDFFRGHFPGDPIVPGVLLTEAAAQLAGLVLCSDTPGPGPGARLARTDMKFPAACRPPTTVTLTATQVRVIGALALFDVTATATDVVVATGSVTLVANGTTTP